MVKHVQHLLQGRTRQGSQLTQSDMSRTEYARWPSRLFGVPRKSFLTAGRDHVMPVTAQRAKPDLFQKIYRLRVSSKGGSVKVHDEFAVMRQLVTDLEHDTPVEGLGARVVAAETKSDIS